ncbi:TPA: hypothetical protein SBE77_000798 [Campylobacter jejuni]|uniref:hypothetical protein n=1 Tax=Campylobacter jejuni TaxID=197 RepID=UPI000257ED72|nr:hypothetical protein [Campylobacter jejuni]EAH4617586.1 hypothetical protein [Campylobacter jejuni]EAH8357063.1 hypothetical protein [Campylobacter jejuni]EAI3267829.1 hypothetical protein [Campylobacter jejuni]EAI4427012.1 hypothetical protein [Campylobacter jejuni]EAJ7477347.1 hypothetical protein [Campylobacter jejuni]
MEVYARYFDTQDYSFRMDTLLCFGQSAELLGSAVLLNPGSSKCKEESLTCDELNKIREFYKDKKDVGDFDSWKKFSPDSTMREIERIFNGQHIDKKTELNGIIQIFNLFNLKNSDSDSAIKEMCQIENQYLFSNDIHLRFYNKIVYFGFGKKMLKYDILRKRACDILKMLLLQVKKIMKYCLKKMIFIIQCIFLELQANIKIF